MTTVTENQKEILLKLGTEAVSELLLENKLADDTTGSTGCFFRRSEITTTNDKKGTVKNCIYVLSELP